MKRIASAAFVVTLGTAVYAHHSHPDFLADQRVRVEGTIEFLQYVNPHSLMTLRTADGWAWSRQIAGLANVQP